MWIYLLFHSLQTLKVVHVPLDQRFTTRVAFLNMALLTPFQIISLPKNYLPSLKKYTQPNTVLNWTISTLQTSQAAVLSLESVLYGSLIASRISNDSYSEVKTRLESLLQAQKVGGKVLLSAVVMRIPAYNGDFEQPWYWANYGASLFGYSYYFDKYNQTKDPKDKLQLQKYKAQVPQQVLQQFLWRRSRNHQILLDLIQNVYQKRLSCYLYITLDDSSPFGLNQIQARQIKSIIQLYNMTNVYVYQGADQVALVMLSKLTVLQSGLSPPSVSIVVRNSSTMGFIPNYQGQSIQTTMLAQINAAGGVLQESVARRGKVTLLLNNFDSFPQKESVEQQSDSKTSYKVFDNFICDRRNSVLSFSDSKYSNGADKQFVKYLLNMTASCKLSWTSWVYAGWNTNGNTLGTAIANSIILSNFNNAVNNKNPQKRLFQCQQCSDCSQGDVRCANQYFNALRILEDSHWQSDLRTYTRNYISRAYRETWNDLSTDLQFYQRFVQKCLIIPASALGLQFVRVYFPWNRTFEIGLKAGRPKAEQIKV